MSRKTVEEMTNSFNQNPYLFIVGCPRSGTTLLKRMVDAHPHIAITPETQWIPRYFKRRKGLTPKGLVTPKLIHKLFEHRRFPLLGIDRDKLVRLIGFSKSLSYSSFVTGIFDLYGEANGKQLVGDKTSGYVRNLHVLHTLWPRAKFVHLIRDGRDVCLSIINWSKADRATGFFATWAEDPVSTTALWWQCNVQLGREVGYPLGPDLCYEIRYESLVADPANECAKLCAFLGVPYDDAMLRYHESRKITDPGLEEGHPWLPITPGLRNWRSQMPAEDVERFEAAAGDLLNKLGYNRAFLNPRPETVKYTLRIRDLFTHDARSRGWRLPKCW